MSYELTGKIKLIQETQTFNSGFSKREMVVTVEDGNYPQDISLEFLKEKIKFRAPKSNARKNQIALNH